MFLHLNIYVWFVCLSWICCCCCFLEFSALSICVCGVRAHAEHSVLSPNSCSLCLMCAARTYSVMLIHKQRDNAMCRCDNLPLAFFFSSHFTTCCFAHSEKCWNKFLYFIFFIILYSVIHSIIRCKLCFFFQKKVTKWCQFWRVWGCWFLCFPSHSHHLGVVLLLYSFHYIEFVGYLAH